MSWCEEALGSRCCLFTEVVAHKLTAPQCSLLAVRVFCAEFRARPRRPADCEAAAQPGAQTAGRRPAPAAARPATSSAPGPCWRGSMVFSARNIITSLYHTTMRRL